MTAASREAPKLQDKRERILRAAIDVFARNGYFASKVSEVAHEAGVADGTIYLYFQGKEDLLLTIFREYSRRFLEGLDREIDGVDDPRERIERLVRFHLVTFASDRSLAVVFQVELRHSRKFMSQLTQQEVGEYLLFIRAIVEEGQRRAVFRSDISPHLVANSLFGALDEMVTSWILSDKVQSPVIHAGELAALILGGVDAR